MFKCSWTDITQRRMPANPVVNLSEGVTPSARLQNRTGEFPRIRLLNDRVFDTDTVGTASVSFIMAMAVQEKFVAEFFSSTLTSGRNMIDFDQIRILKEQPTPATFSLLLAQQDTLHPIEERMGFQSLAPGEEIAIVGTGCSLDFDVLLDVRLPVFPQWCFLAAEMPALSFLHVPVCVRDPVSSLVRMASPSPPS